MISWNLDIFWKSKAKPLFLLTTAVLDIYSFCPFFLHIYSLSLPQSTLARAWCLLPVLGFKNKKHGLPCVDFKDNRDNRDNSLILAFANRHKSEVRAMALILYVELSQMHNKHIFNRLSSQASVAALDFVACQSKKAANIHNRWLSCQRQRSLRSHEWW